MSMLHIVDRLGVMRQKLIEISISSSQMVGEIDHLASEISRPENQSRKPRVQEVQEIQEKVKPVIKRRYKKRSRKQGEFPCNVSGCTYIGPTKDARYQHLRGTHPKEYAEKYGKTDVQTSPKRQGVPIQKVKEILEAAKDMKVKDIVTKFGVSDAIFYQWRKKYGEYGVNI